MDIKVGEYVRTKSGEIAKLIKIDDCSIGGNDYWFDKDIFHNSVSSGSIICGLDIERFINKHSKNIIDLIEVGDLVKFKGWGTEKGLNVIDMRSKEKLSLLFPDAEFCDGWVELENKEYMIYDLDYLVGKEETDKISWILTHEQIKSNCYRLEE